MIKDLWKIEEILASSKGNRVACEPTEVRMDEDDIRNVGQHAKPQPDQVPMFDVLRG